MVFSEKWERRTFLGSFGALAGTLLSPRKLFAGPVATAKPAGKMSGFGATGNVYEELGVTTVINGQGTMTVLGGSLMRPEVEEVMALASLHFVSVPELEVAAGKRIAEMLKLPEGNTALVTSGAAAAMQSGLAGILTGDNPKFIEQLPDLTGMKSEVIIQKSHRNPFDHQLRSTGFIDAAADTPPVSHLWDYTVMGYDLAAFSGGKAIRGPQCAGLLIGRKDLVAYALLNNSPHEDTLGRSQKVGKEEIIGMVKALESYLKEDHEALNKEWQRRLEAVSAQITKVPGVSTSYMVPDIANHVPHMVIKWDAQRISLTPREAGKALRAGKPSIVLSTGEEGEALSMNSFMLQPGEEKIIAENLVKLFKSHSA